MKWWMPWLVVLVVAGGVVLAVNTLTGEQPMHVTSVAVGENPRVLEVTYSGPAPPCETPTRVSVEESDAIVEIRAWAERPPDGVCPALARILTTRVELDDDLGNRAVIDGNDGVPLPVEVVDPPD